ncbi:response regulator [Paenibacillus sp. 1P07SE]|uniref:response regulator n=1 Tax=Paenibacillus sp. 1P07SE TaxID=3132209 RepID=UPI0039A61772
MKLSMIIADDEYNVREGLREVVEWERLGIEVVAAAADGPELLTLCDDLNPDIVLTDIRMPEIDGLQAAERLRSSGHRARIILISGVQDFHYAKTALSLKADGYILKPIKVEELERTVAEVAASIRSERSREEQERRLRQQLQEQLPVLRERFLAGLVTGMFCDKSELAGKLRFFGLERLAEGTVTVAVLEIDDYGQAVERYSEENRQLIMFSVGNILEEIALRHPGGIVFSPSENHFVVLFCGTPEGGDSDVIPPADILQEMLDNTSTYLKMTLSAGIGHPVDHIVGAHQAYQEAKLALGYRFYTGNGAILPIGDFGDKPIQIALAELFEQQSKLIQAMKLGNTEETAVQVAAIFARLGQERSHPISYVQSIGVELINMASRAFHELGESVEKVLPDLPETMAGLYRQHHIADLTARMQELFREMTRFFLQKNNQKNSGTIKKIQAIIAQRYMENMTVGRLSEEVFLSPNYISFIFRQETGMTVTEYVTRVRMEAAKELLKSPDLKVLEVAEMIGYENATYFSTVFKKYTGIHPQKYRSMFRDDA